MHSSQEVNQALNYFESVFRPENISLIQYLWNTNLLIKHALADQIHGISVSFETRKRMFNKAAQLGLTEITNFMSNSPDIWKALHPEQQTYDQSSVNMDYAPYHQAVTQPVVLNLQELMKTYTAFKTTLEQEDNISSLTIWRHNPALQICLADQIQGIIPLALREEIFLKALTMDLTEITDVMLKCPQLRKWNEYRLLMNPAIEYEQKEETHEIITIPELLQENISIQVLIDNFEKQIVHLQDAGVLQNLSKKNQLKNWYTGKPVNFGTGANPLWKQLSVDALLQRFKRFLNAPSIPYLMIHCMFNDVPEIKLYLKGWPVNTGTKVKPPLLTKELIKYFTFMAENFSFIAEEMWQDNVVLQNAVELMPYQPFEALLKKIYANFTNFNAFIKPFKQLALLESFLKNAAVDTHTYRLGQLIAEHIKNMKKAQVNSINDIQSHLLQSMPMEGFNNDNIVQIPSEILQLDQQIKQQLGITGIYSLGQNCFIQVKNVQFYDAYLSAFLLLVEGNMKANIADKKSIENVITRFIHLVQEKPMDKYAVITLWMHNPILAEWFGGLDVACFGKLNNQIDFKTLLSCFEPLALCDPWGFKYILKCMLIGSEDLQKYIRNLPFKNHSKEPGLHDYLIMLVKSQSLHMVNLIMDKNSKLQNNIKHLDFQEKKTLLEIILENFPAVNKTNKEFIRNFIDGIGNVLLLLKVLDELSSKVSKLGTGFEIRSNEIQRALISIRMELLPPPVILKKRKVEYPEISASNDTSTVSNKRQKRDENIQEAQVVYLAQVVGEWAPHSNPVHRFGLFERQERMDTSDSSNPDLSQKYI